MTFIAHKYNSTKYIALRRNAVMLLLACWLFVTLSSLVHAQQHITNSVLDQEQGLISEFQCQLCLNSVVHTPFIATHPLVVSNVSPIYCDVCPPQLLIVQLSVQMISNRDPPVITQF